MPKYYKARTAFATKKIDWLNDEIRCYLVSLKKHSADIKKNEFLSEIAAEARSTPSLPLTNKRVVDGKCYADAAVWKTMHGPECDALVVVQWTGKEETSRLLYLLQPPVRKSDDEEGFPFKPRGGDLDLGWQDYIIEV